MIDRKGTAHRSTGTDRIGGGRLAKFARRARASCAGFRREDGTVAVMTAIAIVPIVFGIAFAIDSAEIYRAKYNFQQATDAAVLVTTNMFSAGSTREEAIEAGKRTFQANLANIGKSTGKIEFTIPASCRNDPITAEVEGEHPLFFPGLHKVGNTGQGGEYTIPVFAQAECPSTSFEIAMVLDTSGSMDSRISGERNSPRKIDTLKMAAKDLVRQFAGKSDEFPDIDPNMFAIVPFSSMVNIGTSHRTASGVTVDHRTAPWMDTAGVSPIHHLDLKWDTEITRGARRNGNGWVDLTGQPLTRFTLFDDLGEAWGGCVSARPYPHSTTDTVATPVVPATMFVPTFAPDEPDNVNGQRSTVVEPPLPYCTGWRAVYDGRGRFSTYRCRTWSDGRRGQTNSRGFPATPYPFDNTFYVWGEYQFKNGRVIASGPPVEGERNFDNNYLPDNANGIVGNQCNGTSTHEDCSGADNQIKRQFWTAKYRNQSIPNADWRNGPNYFCASQPIMPLQAEQYSRSTPTRNGDVRDKIDSLTPLGATNIAQGAAWGWRALSSAAPFEGRPERRQDNRKIMILMTDGANTHYTANQLVTDASDANGSVYGGFGYARYDDGVDSATAGDGFMFDGFSQLNPRANAPTFSKAMDEVLIETCSNAKQGGIIIYSIAFDVARGSDIKEVLEGCASPPSLTGEKFYFDASNSQELREAFAEIASSLKRLKLTR